MYFLFYRIKGLSRTNVIETIEVDVDNIDIGEPLSDNLPLTVSPSTESPLHSPTSTANSTNTHVNDIHDGPTLDDRSHVNGPMGMLCCINGNSNSNLFM